ncbi:Ribonuclease Z [Methanosarcinaceae archaeon Ag5]|uniref:Ribonuclease Z n=1 Tax=Methanolapillus africanus TaxID=3028297 RepID=A0AAE4SD41_9EURY|nr:Ribonuclease Z [Methanosarcinaceae archaeon Ag5]
MIKIVFLGTGGGFPSKERNTSSILLNRDGEMILFDCGEGTQQQMMRAKTGMMKLHSIFLSHFHGDHILGLPGLLQTLAFLGQTEEIAVYGPSGIYEIMDAFSRLGMHKLKFPLKVEELSPGDVVSYNGYTVKAVRADHDRPALGFVLEENRRPGRFNKDRAVELGVNPGPNFSKLHNGQSVTLPDGTVITSEMVVGPMRPGIKIAYSGDTRATDFFFYEAQEADVVIHEATFTEDMKENADEWAHSTAKSAARLAKKYDVRKLVLTHISQRFSDDVAPVLDEAKTEFEDVAIAEDLMEVDVKNRDE